MIDIFVWYVQSIQTKVSSVQSSNSSFHLGLLNCFLFAVVKVWLYFLLILVEAISKLMLASLWVEVKSTVFKRGSSHSNWMFFPVNKSYRVFFRDSNICLISKLNAYFSEKFPFPTNFEEVGLRKSLLKSKGELILCQHHIEMMEFSQMTFSLFLNPFPPSLETKGRLHIFFNYSLTILY